MYASDSGCFFLGLDPLVLLSEYDLVLRLRSYFLLM